MLAWAATICPLAHGVLESLGSKVREGLGVTVVALEFSFDEDNSGFSFVAALNGFEIDVFTWDS